MTAIVLVLAARLIAVAGLRSGGVSIRSLPHHDSVVAADVAVSAEADDDHAGKVS